MRQSGLPVSLLQEKSKVLVYLFCLLVTCLSLSLCFFSLQHSRVHLLETESFSVTFGPKSQRKRPNIKADDIQV